MVQGSNPYRLTIAPSHDPSTNPDDFVGKLMVMLQPAEVTSPPTVRIAGGQWVVIQAPVSLGRDSAELVRFASGVQVLVTAQPGHG